MTASSAGALVDTNVLIYSFDRSQPAKQERATQLLEGLAAHGDGALSTQVLGEFYSISTRKLIPPLPPVSALAVVDGFLRTWRIFDVTAAVIREAVRGVREHQLSYLDAQIWAVARLNSIPVVLSEDFSHNRTIGGVRFLNPFRADFRTEDWRRFA